MDWLLKMATNPLLKLISLLGFKSSAKTIDWLLNQAQLRIAAPKMNGFKPSERPKLSSAMNVTPQLPSTQWETPVCQTTQFHNFDGQSHNQLQSNHGQSFTQK